MIVVCELNIYPIKSCAGIALSEGKVGARGFEYDRSWMVVSPDGTFLTQRAEPRLALVRPQIHGTNHSLLQADVGDRQHEQFSGQPLNGVRLVLRAEGMPELEILVSNEADGREQIAVTVWDDTCQAFDEGEEAAAWFTRFLGEPYRLAFFAPGFTRPVNRKYAKSAEDQVGFADGYPFLLISQASLQDLNQRLPPQSGPLPMNRFRPNIVTAGCDAFAEDGWKHLTIGEVDFAVVKPCDRCVITTIDQSTAERGKEPLATLSRYRSSMNKVLFGQNLIHRGAGFVRLGDRVITE